MKFAPPESPLPTPSHPEADSPFPLPWSAIHAKVRARRDRDGDAIATGSEHGSRARRHHRLAEDPEALSSFAVGKWKVLVVDDEPEVHDVTALALKGVSFHLVRIV